VLLKFCAADIRLGGNTTSSEGSGYLITKEVLKDRKLLEWFRQDEMQQ